MTELPVTIEEPWLTFVCPCGYKMELGGGYHSIICGGLCGRHFRVDFDFDGPNSTVEMYPDILPESIMKNFRGERTTTKGGIWRLIRTVISVFPNVDIQVCRLEEEDEDES